MLDCKLCSNTRHRIIGGKLTRCTCYNRIWAEAKMSEGGLNPKLLKNFWTEDHLLSIPSSFTDSEKKSFAVLEKVASRVAASERSNKQLWLVSYNSSFHYHGVAYLAAMVSLKKKSFRLLEIEELSADYFSNKKAALLSDLTFIKFGAELSKNLTQQLIKRIQDKAIFQNKYIVFVVDCQKQSLTKDYPGLSSIIESGIYLPY